MEKIIHNPLRSELQSGIRIIHNLMDENSDEILIFDDSKSYNDFISRLEILPLRAQIITYRYANERPESAKDFSNYSTINFDVSKL